MNFWLLKSEPDTYSIDDLERDGTTSWTGVRSYAARKHIRAMQNGDSVFIYHSGKNPEIVGEGSVTSLPYPETEDPDWTTIDIEFTRRLNRTVTREELLQDKVFKDSILQREGRLSVQPVTDREAKVIQRLGSRPV